MNSLIVIVAVAAVAQIATNLIVIKGQRRLMATDAQVLAAVATIRTSAAAMETRVDAVIAAIQDPNNPGSTASDAVVAQLTALAADFDKFHAPLAVIATPPTP